MATLSKVESHQTVMPGAIFLIVLGSYLIIKPWFDERQLFGKAEES